MITDYLVELVGELRVPAGTRRRILTEVEDHLNCAAAELHATGLEPTEAEREAVRRFGPASALARAFVEEEAAFAGRRLAWVTGLLGVLVALSMLNPIGNALPTAQGGPPLGPILVFVLNQVVLASSGLTVLRSWSVALSGGPRRSRLTLVIRGATVAAGASASLVVIHVGDALVYGAGAHRVGWLALACLSLGTIACAVRLSRTRRLAAAADEMRASGGDESSAPEWLNPLTDVQALIMVALARMQVRVPGLGGFFERVGGMVRSAPTRMPGLAAFVDLRRRPWRCAALFSMAAGLLLATGHGFSEGGPDTAHPIGSVLAAVLILSIEAVAALLGFAVFGRFLGLRAPARSQHLDS